MLGLWAAQDIGKAINPVLCKARSKGNAPGDRLGAVRERRLEGRRDPQNARMTNYVIRDQQRRAAVPTRSSSEHPFSGRPNRTKGVGELPMDGGAPAIAWPSSRRSAPCATISPMLAGAASSKRRVTEGRRGGQDDAFQGQRCLHEREIDAPPLARLVDVLRVSLGLTGTKEGCDDGECGACSVLLDGVPVNACLVAAGQCEGHEIVTVEGLATGEALTPLQQCFIEDGGAQCGICTPGMLIAAEALLRNNPKPDVG